LVAQLGTTISNPLQFSTFIQLLSFSSSLYDLCASLYLFCLFFCVFTLFLSKLFVTLLSSPFSVSVSHYFFLCLYYLCFVLFFIANSRVSFILHFLSIFHFSLSTLPHPHPRWVEHKRCLSRGLSWSNLQLKQQQRLLAHMLNKESKFLMTLISFASVKEGMS